MTKKVRVIFHNLRGYDSHLIFSDLNKFDVKISAIPNGLEKYMTFFLSNNLVFIESMQFLSSSLDKLIKNLLDGKKGKTDNNGKISDRHVSVKNYLMCEKSST